MRKRSNIYDFYNLDACAVHSADSAFATVAGTFNISFHLAETQIVGYLGAILCCHLGCVGCVLLAATETHLAG